MILATSWMLRASPGPIAGAPLKSPMVSLTWPKPLEVVQIPVAVVAGGTGAAGAQVLPTAPTPEARLMRLKRLKKSARSWTLTRSVIGTFLINERSTSPNPGPVNLFRERFAAPGHAVESAGFEFGRQNAAGFHHCVPKDGSNVWLTLAYGLPIRDNPESVSSEGCPLCQFITVLTCQSLNARLDQEEVAQGALGTS